MAMDQQRTATASVSYTQNVTAAITTLMRDRGLNESTLITRSGVPRSAVEGGLRQGKPWKTNHLEAIAKALDTDLAALVSPGMLVEKAS